MAEYTGEIVKDGEEETYYTTSLGELTRMLRSLQPGDALVINRQS